MKEDWGDEACDFCIKSLFYACITLVKVKYKMVPGLPSSQRKRQ